jgi:hypothetical protein
MHLLIFCSSFLICFLCTFSCFVRTFYLLSILCFCAVFCIVSPFVYGCFFPIFVQVYPPLTPDGNPLAVYKYHIIIIIIIIIIFSGSAAQRGLWSPRSRGFLITHNDAPQSVGPHLTSDQLIAEISIWQHTKRQTSMPPLGLEPIVTAKFRL